MANRGLLLFRAILREHRLRLPTAMRNLGNSYVKNEFKLHKNAKQEHLPPFFEAWEKYLVMLRSRVGQTIGIDLSDDTKASLSEDQKSKLRELKDEAVKAAKD